ncbi:PITH domain-containing protein 1-like isoform X2 [Tubulanus polymorphus]|uniref:PITH domain-containing protein 1-like isoform X2 n=1 Tax=Tubulanus polymorphus TaxID=672921 RepID=UPI003DA35CD2
MSGPHHHHSGGCCGGAHDPPDRGTEYNLYLKINLDQVECLNETREGSGKYVFKPWENRLQTDKFVESDCDEELLFNIPFTGCVKLKGVIVIGDEDGTHPSEMRLFKNRPHMTFDDCQSKADQTFELNPDKTGQLEYNPKIVKFSSVQHLTIHFPKNFGSETTKIYYIGLKGDFTQAQREGVVICNYEARANPADHKTNLMDNVSHQIQ